MHFESFADLVAMGGYGAYVWSAFGVTFLSLIILTISSILTGKKIIQQVKSKQDRQARIEAAKNLENTL
ncbi:heme exporter protein CcmD [Vibrio sp. TH_r3]|uniref:heme exporter protein CcmD n=1 Tax=Vibrio sp. TH_r3 TaxID=3082084 RepID=UPI0029550B44|nr:heme exporter protein CcmD [Vibrio sp. TH_r3]MDV7103192.1 heme exporter protein CcmD [Vibrio sp. TH_r3]